MKAHLIRNVNQLECSLASQIMFLLYCLIDIIQQLHIIRSVCLWYLSKLKFLWQMNCESCLHSIDLYSKICRTLVHYKALNCYRFFWGSKGYYFYGHIPCSGGIYNITWFTLLNWQHCSDVLPLTGVGIVCRQ